MVKLVQGLGSNSYRYPQKDLQILARYANGLEVKPKETKITDGLTAKNLLSYPTSFTVYSGYRWLKTNKGNYKNAFNEVAQNAKKTNDVLKQSGISGVLRNAEATEILSNIPEETFTKTLSQASQSLYADAKKLATDVTTNTGDVKSVLKEASQKLAEAKASTYAERTANATGKFAQLQKKLGITALNNGLNKLAVKSPIFSKALNAYRNEAGTFMLLIEGGMEAAFNVVPTFKQLGAKRGFKQLGKSTATTLSSVAGWVLGSVIGSKAGSVIKAATGSNKVGTLVGALADKACSYIGGSIVQNLASNTAKKLVGKSEMDKAKDEETDLIAEMAQTDEEVLQTLLQAANERMEKEGTETEDYKLVQQACMNLMQSQQASPMLNREQLAELAKSLEDVEPAQQETIQQPVQQAQAQTSEVVTNPQAQQTTQAQQSSGLQDSARAQRALRNSAAFMDKVSKTILK